MTGLDEDFKYSLTMEEDKNKPERIYPPSEEKMARSLGPDRLSDEQAEYIKEMERKEIGQFHVTPVKTPSREDMKPPMEMLLQLNEAKREPIQRIAAQKELVAEEENKAEECPLDPRPPHGPEEQKLKWEERLENIKIIKNLGKGEFGKVDLAIAGPDDNRKLFAVKSMKDVKDDPILADHTERLLESFLNEIHILMKLKHHRIAEAKGVDIQNTPLLVLTYYENGSLLEYLKEKTTSVSNEQRLTFLVEIAEGVSFLQSKRVIHRDLAARNCLLDIGLHVRICDFGFAVELDEEADEYIDAWEWRPYRFLPPEVFSHNVYSMKTDIFSIGVMIYEVYANGLPPFDDLFLKGGEDMSIFQKEVFVLNFWGNQKCVLPIPPPCTKQLITIAYECWEVNADRRPAIETLLARLQECK